MIFSRLRNLFQKRRIPLINQLPPLSGKVIENEPMKKHTWFGVGGPAFVYVEPADVADLERLVRFMPDVPLTILGAGSNVLVRDGGIPGITVHLGKTFAGVQVDGDKLICGAGASVMEVSRVAEKNNIAGFEFLCGIPGSVGGAVRMNAGAHGSAIENVIVSVTVIDKNGDLQTLNPNELGAFSYRHCALPLDWIFVEAVFQGIKVKDGSDITAKMNEYRAKREASQPMGVRTAGSTFKNPTGLSAWKLIEQSGMRGARVGGAMVSDKHANFLINTGTATAKDIETLGQKIQQAVLEKEGIQLEWEVKKLGVAE